MFFEIVNHQGKMFFEIVNHQGKMFLSASSHALIIPNGSIAY